MPPPPFEADRVGIVDQIGNTLLVRGTEPLITEDLHFAYDEIGDALKVDLEPYDFLDLCLIDNVGERWAWEPEIKSFGIDPAQYPTTYWPPYLQKGYDSKALIGRTLTTEGHVVPASMIWWPIEGVPTGQNGKVELGWPGWNFVGLIDYLIELSTTLKNTVIYFHCMLGSDRTGAAHIGYLMKAKNMNLTNAIEKSQITKATLPRFDYMNLVEAYAKQLGE